MNSAKNLAEPQLCLTGRGAAPSVSQMTDASLDTRAADLLKLLVERYIREGQPVGSRTLSQDGRLALSAATIRNVMADLDALGLVASPHTSAGRVPTNQGYRYFVDALLEPESVSDAQARLVRELLNRELDSEQLLHKASEVLSSLSLMAGVVTVPRRNRAVLRRIEFLPLSGRRVLAILVVNERQVQNRIVAVERDYSGDELQALANAINSHFVGRDMLGLHQAMVEDLQRSRDQVNQTLLQAVQLASAASMVSAPDDLVIAGGSRLMGFAELADIQRLRALFDAFDRKQELLGLFDRCLMAEGVQIFIGDESGYSVLDECSVVTAPYSINGEVAGVLGVIGPTRMAYSRIISLVRATANTLSNSLAS